MPTKVAIPKPSANIEEVMLHKWIIKEGDSVGKRDPLAELTTDKAAFELEAPRSGVVRRILARPGSMLPVGYVAAIIGHPDEAIPDVAAHNEKIMARHRHTLAQSAQRPGGRQSDASGVRATPAARRLARELGLDLAEIGKRVKTGIITESDVKSQSLNKRDRAGRP